MRNQLFSKPRNWGGISLLAGLGIFLCFVALIPFPSLRGPNVIQFIIFFLLAGGFYIFTVLRLDHDRIPLTAIWLMALLFRFALLANTPTLSDDVYRYLWDGHLFTNGVNPFAFPVNSHLLDPYDTALRGLVNHNWMASPYLPSAQLYFALVERIFPQSILAYQIAGGMLDLLTGVLVMDILRMLGLPRRRVLIYLWNPLIVLEFTHGAHIDALMIFLVMASFWFIVRAKPGSKNERVHLIGSVTSLATATLTKALPALLLLPLFLRRWGWLRVLSYLALLIVVSALFALGAGWGLSGPLDGTGLFGALRIYARYWNYNSGIYHWLEVLMTGYQTPGAVPVDMVSEAPIWFARWSTTALIGFTSLVTGVWAWRRDDPQKSDQKTRNLFLLRLAVLPISTYLLFTTTLHPWYLTLILPFLPFLLPGKDEVTSVGRFIWPWIYFSCVVVLSYLTYLDPQNYQEFYLVRQVEYIPLYLLLVWAAWPYIYKDFNRLSRKGTG